MVKSVYVEREPFVCLDCGKLVSIDEQRQGNFHQRLRCSECYKKWHKEYVRNAVKKHREGKEEK